MYLPKRPAVALLHRLTRNSFATLAFICLLGCGGEPHDADPILDHPELGRIEDEAPSGTAACPMLPEEPTTPVLPMPWDRIVETFVPPGNAVPTFTVDYDVVPLASVESLAVDFDYDARSQPAGTSSTAHCPESLPTSTWAPGSISDDVARVRVTARGGERPDRRADLFVSRGPTRLTIPLAGIDRTSTDPEDVWVVAFEPASGRGRLALALVPADASGTLTLSDLPSGAGRVLVLQTASVIQQPGTPILHAPHGFAADWSAYARGWYQALWLPPDALPAALQAIVPPNVTATYALLGEPDLRWSAGDAPKIVGLSGSRATGTIAIACGTNPSLANTGFATLDVAVNGGAPTTLPPGAVAHPGAPCGTGTTTATWSLSSQSLNGRRSDVVVGGAP